jgi:ABC-type sulfate transport system substrate-binding protein
MGVQVNRADILDTAKDYVTKDRAATHGDAERNFGLIAAYWSAHLNKNISPHDVAVMMTLLKLARAKSNPKHADNWIDGCGYLALGGEAAMEEV